MIEEIQKNYLELWKRLAKQDLNWKIIYNKDVLYLKSSSFANEFNIAWNITTAKDYQFARNIYGKQDFYFFTNDNIYIDTNIERIGYWKYMWLTPYEKSHDTKVIKKVKNYNDICKFIKLLHNYKVIRKQNLIQIFEQLIKYIVCYMVCDKDEVVGIVFYYIDDDKHLLIYELHVRQDKRNKGIGKLLMMQCINDAYKHEVKKIILLSTKEGQYLYEQLRFKKTMERYYVNIVNHTNITHH